MRLKINLILETENFVQVCAKEFAKQQQNPGIAEKQLWNATSLSCSCKHKYTEM